MGLGVIFCGESHRKGLGGVVFCACGEFWGV